MSLRPERWFLIFILLHLLGWTLLPALVRYNLPLDAIEGTIWGHQLEWGYDKNPYLNGWLTALAVYLGGQSGWMIYLFSQLSVIIAFYVIFQLTKTILSPLYALIAVLLMEGVQYYNFHSIDFNDNNLELGLWALTIYFFYRALNTNTGRAWLFTGLFAGFALMAKYYTAVLLVSMCALLLSTSTYRKQLLTKTPYLALATFLIVITPHFLWLPHHDFITVRYVFERASSPPHWSNHLFFPAQFAWQQAQVFLPVLLLTGLLFIGKKPFFSPSPLKVAAKDKQFLLYMGLGPFLVTVMLSVIFGIKLRAGWGMPLFTLSSLSLLAWLQPNITRAKLSRFLFCIFTLLAVLFYSYRLSLIDSPDASSANFPGEFIAQTVTTQWQARYHTKLEYVAGSRWVGGNVSFYSKDHPAVFIEWDKKRAPWIDETDLLKKGAVFIWSITDNETLPEEIRKKYPQLTTPIPLEFPWYRNTYQLPPIRIGLAFLPPQAAGFLLLKH